MKKKIFLIFIIAAFIIVFFTWIINVFEEQIKDVVKQHLYKKIIREEEYLFEVIEKIEDSSLEFRNVVKHADTEDSISYKELDCDAVEKIFKDFRLIYIEDRSDNPEGHFIHFQPYAYIGWIWPDYIYGFYYSEDDEAINVIKKNKCNAEYAGELGYMFDYYYKTEKIVKNWWYYDMTTTSKY